MFLLPVLLGPGYNYDYNISEETECSNSSDDIPSSIKGSTYNHNHNNNSDCQSVPKNGYCLNYHHIRLNPKDRDDGIIFKWKSSSSLATNAFHTNMNGKVENPTNNNDSEPIILLSGWLYKMKRRSKLYGDWNKRWVTLEHDCIVWRHHGNNHHTKEKKRSGGGRIELVHVDSILVLKTNTKSSQKVFVIKSSQRNLCLMAKTSTDCDKWVRAIQLQMDLQSGGTFSGPACTKNHRRRSSRTTTNNTTTTHGGIIGNNNSSGGDKFDNMMKHIDNHLSCLTQMEDSSKVVLEQQQQNEEEEEGKEGRTDETSIFKESDQRNWEYTTTSSSSNNVDTSIVVPLSPLDSISATSSNSSNSEIEEFIIQCDNDRIQNDEVLNHHPLSFEPDPSKQNGRISPKNIPPEYEEEDDDEYDIENLVVY